VILSSVLEIEKKSVLHNFALFGYYKYSCQLFTLHSHCQANE